VLPARPGKLQHFGMTWIAESLRPACWLPAPPQIDALSTMPERLTTDVEDDMGSTLQTNVAYELADEQKVCVSAVSFSSSCTSGSCFCTLKMYDPEALLFFYDPTIRIRMKKAQLSLTALSQCRHFWQCTIGHPLCIYICAAGFGSLITVTFDTMRSCSCN
jgi:hypothetical protein